MSSPTDRAAGSVSSPPSGDVAALMVKYGPALHRYFVRKAGPTAADDLVQEVFLRLQVSAEHGAAEGAERFIFRLAKRVLIDRRRLEDRRAAGLHDPLDEAGDENLLDDITPERTLAAKQEFERVFAAIMNMPPRMRQAFVLHRFAKFSYGAIAKHMGVSKGAVQGLMERAIARITSETDETP